MKIVQKLLLVLGLMTVSALAQTPQQHADRIFVNGKIWTEADARPQAQAMAIGGDKILAVGSNEEVRALATTDTAVVDLHGRLVIPGFQDSHLHFPGKSINEVDLHGTETLKEFQQSLADFAKAHPKLPWTRAHGWGYSAWPNAPDDRKYRDAVI